MILKSSIFINMSSIDNIRHGIIEKLMSIKNRAYLEALDKIIAPNQAGELKKVSKAEEDMLGMSDEDIKRGDLISQEDLVKVKMKWLNES